MKVSLLLSLLPVDILYFLIYTNTEGVEDGGHDRVIQVGKHVVLGTEI
jgi:hypothetical protein